MWVRDSNQRLSFEFAGLFIARHSPTVPLRLRALPLRIHPAFNRFPRRPGLAPASWDDGRAPNQIREPVPCILPVLGLRPMTLCFDDDDAIRSDAAAGELP